MVIHHIAGINRRRKRAHLVLFRLVCCWLCSYHKLIKNSVDSHGSRALDDACNFYRPLFRLQLPQIKNAPTDFCSCRGFFHPSRHVTSMRTIIPPPACIRSSHRQYTHGHHITSMYTTYVGEKRFRPLLDKMDQLHI